MAYHLQIENMVENIMENKLKVYMCDMILKYVNFLGRLRSNEFQLIWRSGTQCNWKNQNLGVRFGATS